MTEAEWRTTSDAERTLRPVLLRKGRQGGARGKSSSKRERAASIWQHG